MTPKFRMFGLTIFLYLTAPVALLTTPTLWEPQTPWEFRIIVLYMCAASLFEGVMRLVFIRQLRRYCNGQTKNREPK